MTDLRKPECCTVALRQAHGLLRDTLTTAAEAALDELSRGTVGGPARAELLTVIADEVIPHAEREDRVVGGAGTVRHPLARALPADRRMLEVLADEIRDSVDGISAAAAIGAVVLLCDARWDGCDDAIVPALVEAGVDLEPMVR